jgi:hypothetical protein
MTAKFTKNNFTHPPHDPQLWLKDDATNRPNRNQVYGMHMISTWEIRASRIISTIDTPHFDPSLKSPNVYVLVQKRVREELEVYLLNLEEKKKSMIQTRNRMYWEPIRTYMALHLPPPFEPSSLGSFLSPPPPPLPLPPYI